MSAAAPVLGCRCGAVGACRCDGVPERWQITNPGGLPAIAYRIGDFSTFRHAMLQHLPGETNLTIWQPTARTDLGLQILDWWAYIADILTFYNERIANEDYLGTAVLPESVRRLVGLLGYRPRPGIGAVATLAALATGPSPLVLPAGLTITSKATPGLDPQTFESATTVSFAPPTSVTGPGPDDPSAPPTAGPPPSSPPGTAEAPPDPALVLRGGVLIKGTPTGVAVGDQLLLSPKTWDPARPGVVCTVTGVVAEKDPHGRTNTRVLLTGTGPVQTGLAADFRLARSTRVCHLATIPVGANAVTSTTATVVLDSAARYLHAGDPLVLDPGGGAEPLVVALKAYSEVIWYANADSATDPSTAPADKSKPGIPLIVASLVLDPPTGVTLGTSYAVVNAGWTDIGTLIATPVHGVTTLPGALTLAAPPAAAPGVAAPALLEDANGNGAPVLATPTAGSSTATIAAADPDTPLPTLQPPLRLLWDLFTVTRGATVRDEVLGSGDARLARQDFTLSKSPVTYLSDPAGRSGDTYSSTVVVDVAGRYWTEVPMLYGQGPTDTVFVTGEDEDGKTHVRFGDGVTGARLPSGAVVKATYRVGSGAAVPPAGALSQVSSPVPNLRGVRNPVPPGGGGDPDSPGQLRRVAPRSVLTFGRAVSGDDYAAVAAAAPGVTRADAAWEWDAGEQRPTVRVYVGDDAAAVVSGRTAVRAEADPNRPVIVVPAVARPLTVTMTLRLASAVVPGGALAAVRSALLDAPGGLFCPGVLGLGEALYRSRIEAAVVAVPGVLATHALAVSAAGSTGGLGDHRFDPGPGGFFTLAPDALTVTEEADPDD
jgi:hypothetical protein